VAGGYMGKNMEPAMVERSLFRRQDFQISHDYLERPDNAHRFDTETMAEK